MTAPQADADAVPGRGRAVRFMTIPWASSGTQAYDNGNGAHGVQPRVANAVANERIATTRHEPAQTGVHGSVPEHETSPCDTSRHQESPPSVDS